MRVTCETCGRVYDDVYRLTYCPHARFAMRTVIAGPEGVVGIATTLAEADAMLAQARSGAGGGCGDRHHLS